MSLTEKEKRRIEEEEAYRAKIREEHDSRKALSDQSQAPTKKPGSGGSGCLIVIVGIFIFIAIILIAINPAKQFEEAGMSSDGSTTAPSDTSEEKQELVGNVNFDGSQFHVTNQEDQDWQHCWIKVNSDYLYPNNAPLQKFDGIKAGETISFAPGEFTLKDGTRFNAYTTAPKNFSMDCGGRFAYWAWN